MTVCDRVRESTTEAGVYNLRGVRQRTVAQFFPFTAVRLWLFMVFTSRRGGSYPGYVRVIEDETDKAIFFAYLSPHPHFDGEEETIAAIARLKCSFPRAGRYTVQVWFYQEEGSDILKGESPFYVEEEGS
jgi:hypothetical protein